MLARSLMDSGYDVIYTGLRRSPEEIARRAHELDVDVIAFSILSGSHVIICRQFKALRAKYSLESRLWLVGGVIPQEDHEPLKALGVDGVFTVGTPLESIVDFIRENVP